MIVAQTSPATLAAKQATSTIPIVFMTVFDPVASGFVGSLAQPGGNITGVAFLAGPEIVGKQLELLKEAVPKLSRVAVLRNPANPFARILLREAEAAARSLKMQVHLVEARGPDEFEGAFAAMTKWRAGALFVLTDIVFTLNGTQLADLAAKNRLPAMYGTRASAEAGGLMAYGPSTPQSRCPCRGSGSRSFSMSA